MFCFGFLGSGSRVQVAKGSTQVQTVSPKLQTFLHRVALCSLWGQHGPDPLEGSGVVRSGAISLLIWVISIVTLLITLLIVTHEPPSKPRKVPVKLKS